MKTLGEAFQGRDNHFNLMRLVAAALVLWSHSYPLATGQPKTEPLRQWVGWSWGDVAVDLFFVSSGFLVASSLMRRGDLWSYAWARVLRIYPALTVAVALTVFVLGPLFSSFSLMDYFAQAQTWEYFFKNAVLAAGVEYHLPGVFEGNPYRGAVNGSLWTMPYELRMYGLLAAGAFLVILAQRWVRLEREDALARLVLVTALGSLALHLLERLGGEHREFHRLLWMFFAGAAAYFWRHYIRLSGVWAFGLGLILIAALFAPRLFYFLYVLALPYCVLWLAFAPGRRLRVYNRAGDYSYGLYIYAFPIQQAVAALVPGATPWSMTALALPAALGCAILSWHCIEKPALGFKDRRPSFLAKASHERG